jgi:hypothetical protein
VFASGNLDELVRVAAIEFCAAVLWREGACRVYLARR